MLTSSDYESIMPIPSTKITQLNLEREKAVQVEPPKPQYDSVTISEQTEDSAFRKELVSRLSKEIRTATSTGDIKKIKQEIDEGRYTIDAMRIAGRIMRLDDEEDT